MKAQKRPTTALRKRRQALLRQLPPLKAVLRGSLIERYKRCGKPGCKCADGPGHGPKYYLSVSFPGLRPQMDYVPQESYAQASEALIRTLAGNASDAASVASVKLSYRDIPPPASLPPPPDESTSEVDAHRQTGSKARLE